MREAPVTTQEYHGLCSFSSSRVSDSYYVYVRTFIDRLSNFLTLAPTALSELLINKYFTVDIDGNSANLSVDRSLFRLSRLRIRYRTRLEVVELLLHPIVVVSHLSQLLRGYSDDRYADHND